MKKNMLIKDFFMEIRKSMNRFVSIFLIVAMGVAFFSGIRASEPDMRYTADDYFDERQLMDIRILGTLGLTEADVDAVKALDGVADAVGGYSVDLLSWCDDSQKTFKVMADMGHRNRVDVLEGRMPQKVGECLIDAGTLKEHSYKIGDKITFESGDDSDISDMLTTDTFEVVGIGSSPEYITFSRGSTTVGDGEIDSFAIVTPDSFSSKVFTKIDVWVEDASGEVTYTDGYEDKVETVLEAIEDTLADVRCEARYASVQEEAQEEINDARKELDDARAEVDKKLADALDELESGEAELEDGRKTLEEKKAELADAKAEISANEKKLADARVQVADSEKKLADGWQQYNDGLTSYEQGMADMTAAKKELEDGWAQYYQGVADFEAGKAEAREKLAAAQEQLDTWKSALENYDALKAQLVELESGITSMEEALPQLEAGIIQADEGITALEAGIAQCEAGIAELDRQLAQFPEGDLPGDLAQSKQLLEQKRQAVAAQKAELEIQKETAENTKAELETGKQYVEQQKAEAVAGKAMVEGYIAQIEAQLPMEQRSWEAYSSAAAELESQRRTAEETLAAGQQELDASKAKLEAGDQEAAAGEQKLSEAKATLDASLGTLQSSQAQLDAAKSQLASGQAQLEDAKRQVADGDLQIADALAELEDGEKELADGWKEYEDGKKEAQEEIDDAERKLADAQEEVDSLAYPKWYVSDRSTLSGHMEFGDNADRIRAIGKVFPVLFFLVAALISLTTMTRMVEEQRIQIGTLKALGYSKGAIAGKYICYALLATIGGSIVGILIGEKILPYIIINAYKIVYPYIPNTTIPYNGYYALIAALAAIACVTLATVFACYRELAAVPAALMRPVPPKQGKRILLERVTFLWKRLRFTQKSTLRNLFRYKKRFLMTVFGIGGCMALMVVGYGIKDSIMDIVNLQYNKIQLYSGMVILDEDADEADKSEFYETLEAENQIESYKTVYMLNSDVESTAGSRNVYVVVPEDLENIDKFFCFNDRENGEVYELDDDGVIISEKTAKMLGVGIGDTIFIKEDDFNRREVRISNICENYVSHYIYMTPTLYERVFGHLPEFNTVLICINDDNADVQKQVGEVLLQEDAVLNVSYMDNIKSTLNDMLGSLDIIIVVLIISAGMLAFIVLYNLNNININERRRELATIKVLGFYDMEVAEYVYRENVYLTVIGVIVGVVLGKILHQFIIVTVEIDSCMFGRNVELPSYIYSTLLTLAFSVIVNFAMFYKLRKIDMVESLKSVE